MYKNIQSEKTLELLKCAKTEQRAVFVDLVNNIFLDHKAQNINLSKISCAVKACRYIKNLSLADFAKLLEMKLRTLTNWESGTRVPNLEKICAFAEKCGIGKNLFLSSL